MGFIERELKKIEEAIVDHKGRRAELYAARQALAWALEPDVGGIMSPLEAISEAEYSRVVDTPGLAPLQLHPAWPRPEPPSREHGWPQVAAPPPIAHGKASDQRIPGLDQRSTEPIRSVN